MNAQFSARIARIEEILSENLPSHCNDSWIRNAFGSISPAITAEDISKLTLPPVELVSLGGKRWRPLLLVLSAELAAYPVASIPEEYSHLVDAAYGITPLVEFAHNASLIHDDIEDSSDMRRGKPAAHVVYGVDTAINAGSWLYFLAPLCLETSDLPAEQKSLIYQVYLSQLRRLHLGQSLDIEWHKNNGFIPDIDSYMGMVRLKTGTLAYLAAKVGFLAGGGGLADAEWLAEKAADIGVGFQILDDVINLTTGNKGKKKGDDIVEGKKSLPVILHLQKKPGDKGQIMEYFRQAAAEGPDSSAVIDCISLLESSGAVDEALAQSRDFIRSSCNAIFKKYASVEAAKLLTDLFKAMLI